MFSNSSQIKTSSIAPSWNIKDLLQVQLFRNKIKCKYNSHLVFEFFDVLSSFTFLGMTRKTKEENCIKSVVIWSNSRMLNLFKLKYKTRRWVNSKEFPSDNTRIQLQVIFLCVFAEVLRPYFDVRQVLWHRIKNNEKKGKKKE